MISTKNSLIFGFFGELSIRNPRAASGLKAGLGDIFDPSPYLQVDRIHLKR